MIRTLKAKWVKALRSGKYKQGRDCLKSKGQFCCLGVLRDIVHPRSSLKNGEMLHRRHLNEFGLLYSQQSSLAKRNDEGWSFSRISKWIERNL